MEKELAELANLVSALEHKAIAHELLLGHLFRSSPQAMAALNSAIEGAFIRGLNSTLPDDLLAEVQEELKSFAASVRRETQ